MSTLIAAPEDVSPYELVVGMEVHAQALTQSKMFCRCATDYQGAPPNTRTCPTCLALPGALPVINRAAVEATIKTGLALNCRINERRSLRARTTPIPTCPRATKSANTSCRCAKLAIWRLSWRMATKRMRIRRVHLEEDTGRSVHEGGYSYIDLNRAGVPLMEIVTEADIHSPEEAYAYLTKLRATLRALGVNSGDMEKGALRCEPNISVRTQAQKARGEYGVKVEVKNLNSFRAVRSSIAYELERQVG
jgi:aspartyl-tRNA(Asn)/glutamyl-tRNA(Gln) amidotransferase subunit B